MQGMSTYYTQIYKTSLSYGARAVLSTENGLETGNHGVNQTSVGHFATEMTALPRQGSASDRTCGLIHRSLFGLAALRSAGLGTPLQNTNLKWMRLRTCGVLNPLMFSRSLVKPII